jgi:hypothetical protein
MTKQKQRDFVKPWSHPFPQQPNKVHRITIKEPSYTIPASSQTHKLQHQEVSMQTQTHTQKHIIMGERMNEEPE